jgi:hypothetical protein
MLKGSAVRAREYFNKVLGFKVYGYVEYTGAVYALQNLDAGRP